MDGKTTEVNDIPIFHGFKKDDKYSILTLSFPDLDTTNSIHPHGMIHESDGTHHQLALSYEHGIIFEEISREVPDNKTTVPCDTHQRHDHSDNSFGDSKNIFSKRNIAEEQVTWTNGM